MDGLTQLLAVDAFLGGADATTAIDFAHGINHCDVVTDRHFLEI